MSEKILRASQLATALGVSRQTVWRWTRLGILPPSRQIGPTNGSVGWVESEIDQWIRNREIALGADRVGAAGK